MNDADRENLENKILLRSTGELTPAENAALEKVLASDSEAAEFARFIAAKLPARAPRDFAAAAIRAASPERNVLAFPPLWKLTAAAAAIVIASFVAVRVLTPDATPPIAGAQTSARETAKISARMDTLESELATAREHLARGRYHRQTDI